MDVGLACKLKAGVGRRTKRKSEKKIPALMMEEFVVETGVISTQTKDQCVQEKRFRQGEPVRERGCQREELSWRGSQERKGSLG